MPLNEYWLQNRIDVIRNQRHLQIAAGRYQTSDPEEHRILAGYPGVQFICSKTVPVAACAGGTTTVEAAPLPPAEPSVKTAPGLQFKEKRSACVTGIGLGSRIADGDTK